MSDAPLNEKELAARWGVTPRTLQLWRSQNIGPQYIRVGARSILYRIQDVLAYEATNIEGNRAPPPGWDATVKRAAAALNLLASKASKPEVQKTLSTLRDELRALIQQ